MKDPKKLFWSQSAQVILICVGLLYLWGYSFTTSFNLAYTTVGYFPLAPTFPEGVSNGALTIVFVFLLNPVGFVATHIFTSLIVFFTFKSSRSFSVTFLAGVVVIGIAQLALITVSAREASFENKKNIQEIVDQGHVTNKGNEHITFVQVRFTEKPNGEVSAITGVIVIRSKEYIVIHSKDAVHAIPQRLIVSITEHSSTANNKIQPTTKGGG